MDVCKEKLALMDEYNKATVNYSKAVSLQFSRMGLSITRATAADTVLTICFQDGWAGAPHGAAQPHV